MATVHEKLRYLVRGYLLENHCPVVYADEIVEGILDNFEVAHKTAYRTSSRLGFASSRSACEVQNMGDTRNGKIQDPSQSGRSAITGNPH